MLRSYRIFDFACIFFSSLCYFGCDWSNVYGIKNKHMKLTQIAFLDNPCDSIMVINCIVAGVNLDSTIIEEASNIYFNCSEPRKAINLMLQISEIEQSNFSEDELLRLSEAYRNLFMIDSSLYFLAEFEKICTKNYWTQSQFALWRMQITFEGNRYLETIKYAQIAINSPEGIGNFRNEWPHEYIVQSLAALHRDKEACDYAKEHVPVYFEYMRNTVCKEYP